MSYKLSNSEERASFFTWISSLGSHWQENPTPFEIIKKMVSKTSLNDEHILVLFNIEFLHILIDEQGVSPQDITFIADNHIEKLSANKIFKVQSYWLSDYTLPALKKLVTGLDMKFDLVFSNPPYNKNVDIKILNEVLPIADEWVIIHPSLWLLESKGVFKAYSDFRTKIKNKLVSVEMFNGNGIFDIQLNVPIVITHINMQCDTKTQVEYFDENYTVDSINDITKFGIAWETLVKPFYHQMTEYCTKNGSVWSNRIQFNQTDSNNFHCQLADIRGSKNLNSNSKDLVKSDFYTMTVRDNSEDNKTLRKDTLKNTYEFKTEIERDNFIKYLNTDFSRFCLSILKTNTHIDSGELSLIPWVDFSQEWNDESLFKKFNVNKKQQEYIRTFLPDFYNIRK